MGYAGVAMRAKHRVSVKWALFAAWRTAVQCRLQGLATHRAGTLRWHRGSGDGPADSLAPACAWSVKSSTRCSRKLADTIATASTHKASLRALSLAGFQSRADCFDSQPSFHAAGYTDWSQAGSTILITSTSKDAPSRPSIPIRSPGSDISGMYSYALTAIEKTICP